MKISSEKSLTQLSSQNPFISLQFPKTQFKIKTMFILHSFPSPPQTLPHPTFSPQFPFNTLILPSFQPHFKPNPFLQIIKSSQNQRVETTAELISQIKQDNEGTEIEVEEEDESPSRARFRGRGGGEEEEDYDRNPEFAEIIGSCLDEPEKARSKVSSQIVYLFLRSV